MIFSIIHLFDAPYIPLYGDSDYLGRGYTRGVVQYNGARNPR
jgi:hypothetical protein